MSGMLLLRLCKVASCSAGFGFTLAFAIGLLPACPKRPQREISLGVQLLHEFGAVTASPSPLNMLAITIIAGSCGQETHFWICHLTMGKQAVQATPVIYWPTK
ncbi:hypothetical protein BX661DRAFT_171028 [Kickxella alabastrina]|uniref:uncharacterized protein n=1 Tax=Kickxella alabastrina TaxID=61397 RepID=UPI002220966B|nr:uncharacterized protein BX661DRAFT_171028 [Kickxella alabastrina]KAI7827804.1 hypothetical protein BX661DRAFT_171028 [Kickxella alabastrina]